MSRRYPGRLMGLVASKGTNAASGIWTLKDMRDYCATGKWPGSGGSTPPAAPPGGDPLYSQVRGLYHLDSEIQPSAQVYEYADLSSYGIRMRSGGTARLSTNQSKYGASVSFPYADATGFLFSTAAATGSPATLYSIGSADDFTVEMWAFASSQVLSNTRWPLVTNIDPSVATARGFSLYLQYFLYWGVGNGSSELSTSFTFGQWVHVAVSRAGGTLRLFIDGVLKGSISSTTAYTGDSHTLFIGGAPGVGGFGGWIDDFRLTVGAGAGRYTANFTPPTAPFPDAL